MRGHIVKKYKSSYTILLSLGRDPITNKYKTKSVNVKGTRAMADKKLAELLHQGTTTGFIDSSKTTLGEFLLKWLDLRKTKLPPSSYASDEMVVNYHLIPSLGKIPVQSLALEHVESYYSKKVKQGLNPLTVRKHHIVLLGALETALKWGLVYRNVAQGADTPKGKRKEFETWDVDEVNQFLNNQKDSPKYALFYTDLFTGMRRSEILALRWSDIDLTQGTIAVKRGLHQGKDRKYYYSDTKSAKSRRVIDISPSVIMVLRKHWETSKLPQGQDSLVFSNQGKQLRPNTISRIWTASCKKAGVKVIRLHDARHTHATLLLLAGVHPKIVQERLGHASIAVTLDLYSHVMPTMQKSAAQSFEELFTPKSKMDLVGI